MAMQPQKNKRSSGAPIRRQSGSVNRKKSKGGFLVPILILLAMTMIIALILAAAWEKFETEEESSASQSQQLNAQILSSSKADPFASPASIPSIGMPVSSASSKASSEGDAQSSSEDSTSEPESSSTDTAGEAPASSAAESSSSSSAEPSSSSAINVISRAELKFGAPVPESEQVSNSYFDDAMFVGDSITSGIESYGIMGNATVIANTGINPSTMLTSEVWENEDGSYCTLLDAAEKVDAAKIYVMIGANGVAWIGENAFIDYYTQIIQRLQKDHPDAIIYVQSILPVTKEKSDEGPSMSNGKINMYNERILKMTEELEVYYLDVASAIKNSSGALPSEASPKDGIHFGTATYQKWFDYLRTHTVDK